MVYKKWTKSEVEILKNSYGKFPRSILLKLLPARSYDAISMKAFNLSLRGNSTNSNRKYRVRFNAFSTPDIDSSYWAGFIAADGHITPKNQLIVKLSSKDQDHVESLKQFLEYTGPLFERPPGFDGDYNPMTELCVQSKNICNDLNQVFDIPKGKKSDILRLPEIHIQYLLSYLEGYFDGDGCLYIDSRGYVTITFVGNKNLMLDIKNFIEKFFSFFTSAPYQNNQHSESYMYRVHGAKAIEVLREFNSKYRLKRKRLDKVLY